jgi:very-short-patch-repair endonuclease
MVRAQHGVISRAQLLELGFSPAAIQHRVRRGRLHPVWRGVYAVGRPRLTQRGVWMAAVLRCGPEAVLSHACAATLHGILPGAGSERIDVSVPARTARVPARIVVHRRSWLGPGDVEPCQGIPVTTPGCTLIDIATFLERNRLEAAISQAATLDLIDPEELHAALDDLPRRPGLAALRKALERASFRLTESELERLFLPITDRAGLSRPLTRQVVNGWRVDFCWPELGLVVETDGLRYHRTPFQQEKDRLRDQAHIAAGLTPLRFTHGQVAFKPNYVCEVLRTVARRLRAARR